MRQLCNLSFVVQAEAFADQDELDRWIAGLDLAPGEKPRLRSRVDPSILRQLGGSGP